MSMDRIMHVSLEEFHPQHLSWQHTNTPADYRLTITQRMSVDWLCDTHKTQKLKTRQLSSVLLNFLDVHYLPL